MIENLIIFAGRLFKHKHRLARGTEHQKILVIDPQLSSVSQVQSDGLPVDPNGFDILNSHARKTLTDLPSVFHSDPRLRRVGTARALSARTRRIFGSGAPRGQWSASVLRISPTLIGAPRACA